MRTQRERLCRHRCAAVFVAADSIGLVAGAGLAQNDRAEHGDERREIRIWLLKPSALVSPSCEEPGIGDGLLLVGDGLAAGQAKHESRDR